ncbi:MAG: hypothetical protein OHK0046_18100 [Anaerolineae bacterium]
MKRAAILMTMALMWVLFSGQVLAVQLIERVSVGPGGVEAAGGSSEAVLSADGRFVAFYSFATNLVANDTNGIGDIFVLDRSTDTVERVSVGAGGAEANGESYNPSISADGRYVAFYSFATNLVANDTNGERDIFVFDRNTDTVERVSIGAGGVEANDFSIEPAISGNGNFVAFYSFATNLVAGDTNNTGDIFVYDRSTDTIELITVDNAGIQATGDSHRASLSTDGRYVAFYSFATNLVPNDTNGVRDVFVFDRTTDTVERVSEGTGGTQGNNFSENPSISGDGRYVAFSSLANNLVAGDTNGVEDIFVFDRTADTIQRASVGTGGIQGDNFSIQPSMSANGTFVAFTSFASNLVPGDANGRRDIFVHNLTSGTTERFNITSSGTQADFDSNFPTISTDGLIVAFSSFATNLVPGDTNNASDVFVAEPGPPVYASDPLPGGAVNLTGEVGSTITGSITVTNAGFANLPVTGVMLAGSPEITLAAPTTFALAPSQSQVLALTCASAAVGSYTATVTVTYTLATNTPVTAVYTITCTVSAAVAQAADIGVFDPAVSKLGFLLPGQTGVTGERLRWDVTVTNRGSAPGVNVVLTDTLVAALQVERVETPKGTATINGQTVTLTIETLAPGETFLFSIYTRVLQGATIDNTICLRADNLGQERCATGRAVSQLPNTGETPFWRDWLLPTSIGVLLAGVMIIRGRGRAAQH